MHPGNLIHIPAIDNIDPGINGIGKELAVIAIDIQRAAIEDLDLGEEFGMEGTDPLDELFYCFVHGSKFLV